MESVNTNLFEYSDEELRKDYFKSRVERLACIKLLQCGGGVTDKQVAALRKRADDNLRIMQVIEQEQARRKGATKAL